MSSKRQTNVGYRFDRLQEDAKMLERRPDLKLESGCLRIGTGKELTSLQATVFAGVHGILSPGSSPRETEQIHNLALRWLLIHAGRRKYDFHIGNNNKQWRRVMGHRFSNEGLYSELVMTERVLIEAIRLGPKKTSITDIMLADNCADSHLKTDMVLHQGLPRGTLHLGLQLTIRNHVEGKLGDLAKIELNDMTVMRDRVHRNVADLLRHHTAVLSIPQFHAPIAELRSRLDSMSSGSRVYQSRFQSEHDNYFSGYGRMFMTLLEAFDVGVRADFIRSYHRAPGNTIKAMDDRGEFGVVTQLNNLRSPHPAVILHYLRKGAKRGEWTKIMTYGVPLWGEFLDLYKDKAGIRAK